MNIDREGCELAHIPFTADVTDLTSAQVYLADSWHNAAITQSGLTGTVDVLIAGPACASPGTAVVLPVGMHQPRVKFADSPETVIRGAGTIRVV